MKEESPAGRALNTAGVARPGAFFGRITRSVRAVASRLLRSRLQAGEQGWILDVGCGNGLLFAETGPVSGRRIGSDLDMDLLREAERIFKDNRIEGVAGVRADAAHLPFRSGAIDDTLFLNTLINIPDDGGVRRLLAELARVTRPGGRLYIDIRNASNPWLRLRYWAHNKVADFSTRGYDLSQIRRILEELSCSLIHAHPVGGRLPFGRRAYLLELARQSDAAPRP